MLVIGCHFREKVVIGDPANPLGTFHICQFPTPDSPATRIAFDFPREIEINRESVAKAKLASREAAK